MAFLFSSRKSKVRQNQQEIVRGNSETPVRGLDDDYLSRSISTPGGQNVKTGVGERHDPMNHGGSIIIEDGPEDKISEYLLDLKLRNLRINSKAVLAGRRPKKSQIAKQVTLDVRSS